VVVELQPAYNRGGKGTPICHLLRTNLIKNICAGEEGKRKKEGVERGVTASTVLVSPKDSIGHLRPLKKKKGQDCRRPFQGASKKKQKPKRRTGTATTA